MAETQKHLGEFKSIFAKELTPELAGSYVASLVEALGGQDQPLETLVQKGVALHEYVGETLYGPLIVGYVNWVEAMCGNMDHTGPVFFALRDAAPLQVAAKVLWQGKDIYPVDVYANRPMLNIEDEIDPQWAKANSNVVKYLGMLGLAQMKNVVWADTGAWGTVVKALKVGILHHADFYPLFLYSHNPYIPGYLNGLLAKCGIEDSFGEVLNDSVECVFPQPHIRPLDVVQANGSWQVQLETSGYLSQKWGQAALSGVQKAAVRVLSGQPIEDEQSALLQLKALSSKAKSTGQWTGVLPTNTPTWSKGQEFLDDWPEDLLP